MKARAKKMIIFDITREIRIFFQKLFLNLTNIFSSRTLRETSRTSRFSIFFKHKEHKEQHKEHKEDSQFALFYSTSKNYLRFFHLPFTIFINKKLKEKRDNTKEKRKKNQFPSFLYHYQLSVVSCQLSAVSFQKISFNCLIPLSDTPKSHNSDGVII